jgi:hypothetical protein
LESFSSEFELLKELNRRLIQLITLVIKARLIGYRSRGPPLSACFLSAMERSLDLRYLLYCH